MTDQLRWNTWQDPFNGAKKWAFAIISAGNSPESRDSITSTTLSLCAALEPITNLGKRDGEIDERKYRLLVLDSRVRLDFMDIARAYKGDRVTLDEGIQGAYQDAGMKRGIKDFERMKEGMRGFEKYIEKTMALY